MRWMSTPSQISLTMNNSKLGLATCDLGKDYRSPSPNPEVDSLGPETLRPQPWYSGQTLHHQLPDVGNHWEACKEKADQFDRDFCSGWNSEIDSFLTFAGLFSSVITAFALESYKWLQPDPQDANNQILLNISAQLAGKNITATPPFSPSPSSIRINVFWFLSLTFSLTAALLGMVCKQWLRRYQRGTPRVPNKMGLALHQLRYEGFVWWGAINILATPPLLLEFGLILFFIGLVDFLLGLHVTVAAPVMISVGVSVVFLAITTLAPTFQCIFYWVRKRYGKKSWVHPPMLAFKSPQSLLFLHLATWVFPFSSNEKPLGWTAYETKFISDPTTFGTYTAHGISWLDAAYSHGRDMVHQISLCLQEIELPFVTLARKNMKKQQIQNVESSPPADRSFESYADGILRESNHPEDVAKDINIIKYLDSRLHADHRRNNPSIVERHVRVLNSSTRQVSPALFYAIFRDHDISKELRWQRAQLLQNLLSRARMNSPSVIADEIVEERVSPTSPRSVEGTLC
ncbi:hypothetical protein BD779DRAFT_1544184 [Infundibulicybe gibba]|nr:hypothetical protein BD779DRAFT_1544184 [Infundibulicybe gibba]